MALNPQVSIDGRNAMVDALTARINVGGAGSIKFYNGTQPASPDTAVSTQTLLVSCALSATSFGASSSGTATANAISAGSPVANGTASWFRIFSGGGTAVLDGTAGTSGTDAILGSTTISTGTSVTPTAATISHP